MLLECLVVYACLSGNCQTVSEAYYAQNDEFRKNIQLLETKAINRTPKFVQASVPFVTILYNKKLTLPLRSAEAVSIKIDDKISISYEMGF